MLDVLTRREGAGAAESAEVLVRGALDVCDAPEFEALCAALLEKQPRFLLLDLTDVTFLDIHGARALLRMRTAAWLKNCPLGLVGKGNRPVERLLSLLGWAEFLPLCGSRAEALRNCAATASHFPGPALVGDASPQE